MHFNILDHIITIIGTALILLGGLVAFLKEYKDKNNRIYLSLS